MANERGVSWGQPGTKIIEKINYFAQSSSRECPFSPFLGSTLRVKNVFEPVCQKLNHFSETVYEILKISLVAVSFLILGPSSYCLFQYQSKSIFSLANCWLNPFSFDVEVDSSLFFSCFREKN